MMSSQRGEARSLLAGRHGSISEEPALEVSRLCPSKWLIGHVSRVTGQRRALADSSSRIISLTHLVLVSASYPWFLDIFSGDEADPQLFGYPELPTEYTQRESRKISLPSPPPPPAALVSRGRDRLGQAVVHLEPYSPISILMCFLSLPSLAFHSPRSSRWLVGPAGATKLWRIRTCLVVQGGQM